MSRVVGRPGRVRMPYVEQLAERVSARDRAIISTIHRLRLVSGVQLERLHFHELTGRSRSVKRWQTLKRLVDAGVLIPLDRRVGTAVRGSAGLNYALDSAGQSLIWLQARRESLRPPVRRPRAPGDHFAAHILAVSELYVRLIERSRLGGFTVGEFQVEPRWPNGIGGWLGPDAFIRLDRPAAADYWSYEAELAIKSEPAIRRKLQAHLDFVQRGQLGPDGVVPRVIVGVEKRLQQAVIQSVVDSLPEPADALFFVAGLTDVTQIMVGELMN
jgi:hypothetical protein